MDNMLKKETGKTPQEHMQEKVIEIAKERIVRYPQHLCRLFKKREGCTPNEYHTRMIS